jgi:hypothetical protein
VLVGAGLTLQSHVSSWAAWHGTWSRPASRKKIVCALAPLLLLRLLTSALLHAPWCFSHDKKVVCCACVSSVQTAIHTTAALKGGTAALKGQMKLVSLDEIEDNLDDMAELLEESNEIQEVCAGPAL